MKKQCLRCNKEFEKTGRSHKYCGNALKKTGCSYIVGKEKKIKLIKFAKRKNL